MAAHQPPCLVVGLEEILTDPQLAPGARGVRKLLVTSLLEKKERLAEEPEWAPPTPDTDEKCPVIVTGNVEMSVFTQQAAQERHLHKMATETYHVVSGDMRIEVEGQDYFLLPGDTIVVNPGFAHLVKPVGYEFLAYVFTANCGGDADKFPA